jgi:parallel beta-helix repeat protein
MMSWKRAMVVVLAMAVCGSLCTSCSRKKKNPVVSPVTADFSAEPRWGGAPLSVQFTDQSTSTFGSIDAWEWDFDGDSVVDSTEQNPSHTYNEIGSYTVSLTVSSPGGFDTETKVDFITVVQSTTIRVPDDYPSIQEAIDAANEGDRVVVSDGTHTGDWNDGLRRNKNLELRGKKITVESENGPGNCTIECHGVGRGFNIHEGEDSYTVIKGFTITGAKSSGGGLYIEGASPTITNNVITSNKGSYGGGIYCKNAGPQIKDNTITGNSADGHRGGGIYCCEGSKPLISGNTIKNNEATVEGYGAGICCFDSSPEIINNTIQDNEANSITQGKGRGGGIYIGNCDAIIRNNTITGNKARYSAGIYCAGSGSDNALITENTVSGNSSLRNSGGICIRSCSATVTWNTVTNNSCGSEYGGGILIEEEGANALVAHNVVTGNSAFLGGGIGVWMKANPRIESNLVVDNHASSSGGGLYVAHAKATIVNCTVANNSTSSEGGGLYCLEMHEETLPTKGTSMRIQSDINISYCVVQDKDDENGMYIYGGCNVTWGDGVIDTDPLFAGGSDYHLQTGSPCIDAGNSSVVLVDKDLDDSARIVGSSVDMGTYER